MKNWVAGVISVVVLILMASLFGQEFKYVGVDKCKICHRSKARGAQYTKWKQRKHSQSYEVLTQDKAQEVAKQMGIENPAESPECLKCHAPLYNKALEFKEEGVTCEVCHGPGSEYKSLSVMKDHEKSVANGLTEYPKKEDIKQHCLTCHENPHGIPFDFESAWELVKHYRPDNKYLYQHDCLLNFPYSQR